jgi:hypothetical protein
VRQSLSALIRSPEHEVEANSLRTLLSYCDCSKLSISILLRLDRRVLLFLLSIASLAILYRIHALQYSCYSYVERLDRLIFCGDFDGLRVLYRIFFTIKRISTNNE